MFSDRFAPGSVDWLQVGRLFSGAQKIEDKVEGRVRWKENAAMIEAVGDKLLPLPPDASGLQEGGSELRFV